MIREKEHVFIETIILILTHKYGAARLGAVKLSNFTKFEFKIY